jgi:hypothetical protein
LMVMLLASLAFPAEWGLRESTAVRNGRHAAPGRRASRSHALLPSPLFLRLVSSAG